MRFDIMSNMYEPGLAYMRTPEEKRDVFASWRRDDKAFFASGACHILAHMFLSLHAGEGYELAYIKPTGQHPGNHMYASDGTWAFDFNGWTKEEELLAGHAAAFQRAYPGWAYERIIIREGLPEYLKHSNHLRGPEYFPELPWERANKYLQKFPESPPAK
jgi:hypothetical protein